jgi:AcrR family transcriptional regulator
MSRRNMKHEILQAARQLFNERSYNEVTMRDIADAVGISVGNLTYHFKRKDLIMEASVVDLRYEYKIPLTPTTLEELNKVFVYMAQYNTDNAYYFKHYTQIAQISPRVHQIQIDVVRDLVYMFTAAFQEFQKAELMHAELYEAQTTFLAYSIMNTTTFWIYQREVIQRTQSNAVYEILGCVWSMLTPMLTDKGFSIFESRIRPANEKLR